MRIVREKIFGPVLALIEYDDAQEAIAIANDSPFGLGGAVFTNDPDCAYAVARQVSAGSFGHNSLPVDLAVAPFGGFKESGLGHEGGPDGLDGFTEIKTIYMPRLPLGWNAS
jgi:acyl-CoA reductase-like NAD-dependent aldehyde dehydrogenase